MEVIGITGQTGAGKSTVCKMLSSHGYYHIDADSVAKSLYQKGSLILTELAKSFGSQILTTDGELNKKALAAVAFATPAATELLGSIVHPAVNAKIRAILEEQRKAGTKAVIIDAIALFESGENALCDRTVGVVAPEEIRLSRITARDALTKDEALLRIRAQKEESFYKEHCDAVLRNYPPYTLESEVQRIFSL